MFKGLNLFVRETINCPYCYIGKRHLELALEQFPHKNEVQIVWKSFELDPETQPNINISHTQMLAEKYGKDLAWVKMMDEKLTQMASKVGLEFHMDKVIPANTFNAHRLLKLAKSRNLEEQMYTKLFSAKFTEGQDIGSTTILKKIGNEVGLDLNELEEFFRNNFFEREVRRDEELAGVIGINSVPFFIFDKEIAFSGAQPIEVFLDVLEKRN
ncbi:MAG: DsbA family oxidoreductase [Bacteriovoracaceae bacterium]